MYRMRSRAESFGWIVALPDGSIDAYSQDISLLPAAEREAARERCRIEVPADLRRLRAPISMSLELTLECNLTCSHCYIDAGPARAGELSTDQLRAAIRELADFGVMFLFLTGGEVTLRPDFAEIVGAVADAGLDFNVISNATGLSGALLRRIPADTTFIVSVDGIDAHRLIRGRQSFEQVSRKILALRRAGFPVVANTAINRLNVGEMPRTYEWARRNRVILVVLDLQNVGRAKRYADLLRLRPEDADAYARFLDAKLAYEALLPELYAEAFDPFPAASNPFYYSFEEQLIRRTGLNYQGNFYSYVASDGGVYPDNFYAGDDLYRCGRIGTEPLPVIWDRIVDVVRPSNYDQFDCAGCRIHEQGIFCDFKSAALSMNLHGTPNTCGADETEKDFMLMRAGLRSASASALPEEQARYLDNF